MTLNYFCDLYYICDQLLHLCLQQPLPPKIHTLKDLEGGHKIFYLVPNKFIYIKIVVKEDAEPCFAAQAAVEQCFVTPH